MSCHDMSSNVTMNPSDSERHEKLYIFGKMRSSPFQKYIVFHSYYKDIHLAVVNITPIFPKFSSTLVPFSLIRNHIRKGIKRMEQGLDIDFRSQLIHLISLCQLLSFPSHSPCLPLSPQLQQNSICSGICNHSKLSSVKTSI